MNNNSYNSNALWMALSLSLTAAFTGPANAMSLFDSDAYETATSARMALAQAAVPEEPQTTELPDKMNIITGQLENEEEVKYYSFTAVRGQKVMVYHPLSPQEKSPWKIEYKIDHDWQAMPFNNLLITPPLAPEQKIHVRVLKNPAVALQPGKTYQIEVGSAPRLIKHKVSGDAERYAIHFGRHKFINRVDWVTHVVDSTGHPIEGVTVELNMNTDEHSPSTLFMDQRTSNQSGLISSSFNLGGCVGKNTTRPFVGVRDFKTKWQLTYNTGHWYMSPRGHEDGGVGSRNGIKVSLVHICTQRIVK